MRVRESGKELVIMTVTAIGDARVLDIFREVVENAGVDRVFGPPITQGETIVLPVAKVGSGGGGGSGTEPAAEDQENSGTGGGFGLSAKALGVFVLRDGKVAWHPAVDVNKVIMGGQFVAVAALLVVRSLIKARAGAITSGTRSSATRPALPQRRSCGA